jgi:Uma2 family endonuclease
MAVAEAMSLMTTEEMLALPENGTDRWLVEGHLREKPMTVRNRLHSRIMVCISHVLESWRMEQPELRGSVLCGEVGVRLRRDPDTTVGVDVIYISSELAAGEPEGTTLIDGVPVLAVEILSPNDTLEEMHEKTVVYLRAGVALVWVVDPYDRTVRVYRPGKEPELFNVNQELTAEPQLSGFRVPVAQIFA